MYKINKQFFSPEMVGLDLYNIYNEATHDRSNLIIISKNSNKNIEQNNLDNRQNIEVKNIELINKLGVLTEDKVLANLDFVKSNNYAINPEAHFSHSSSLEIEPLEEIREMVSLLL